jgi:probable HAF family extracellular repeat protein
MRGLSRFALLSVGLAACGELNNSDPTAPDQALTAAATYTVHALAIPSTAITGDATAINDAGIVAGWYRTNAGWTAVRWTSPTQRQSLGKLAGFSNALAEGINQAGTIVGYATSSTFLNSRAWIWTQAGGIKPLPDLGGGSSLAMGINTAGVAVGFSADPQQVTHAVKWTAAGAVVDLNPMGATSEALAVNDSGDVAGWVFPRGGNATHAFLWRRNGTRLDLGTLGGASSQAFAVTEGPTVVGISDRPAPQLPVAFIWTQATGMRPLGLGNNSEAHGISHRNRSVGFRIGSGVTGLTRFQNTTQILPDLAPAKGHFSAANAVNRCGNIVGDSNDPRPTNGNSVPVIWVIGVCD